LEKETSFARSLVCLPAKFAVESEEGGGGRPLSQSREVQQTEGCVGCASAEKTGMNFQLKLNQEQYSALKNRD